MRFLCGVERGRTGGEIGEDYQAIRIVREDGRTSIQRVTETEWRALSGLHARNVMDVLVSASRSVGNSELAKVEPFDLRALDRYEAGLISGWLAEDPAFTAEQCLETDRPGLSVRQRGL